jgi:hypothetical protein
MTKAKGHRSGLLGAGAGSEPGCSGHCGSISLTVTRSPVPAAAARICAVYCSAASRLEGDVVIVRGDEDSTKDKQALYFLHPADHGTEASPEQKSLTL